MSARRPLLGLLVAATMLVSLLVTGAVGRIPTAGAATCPAATGLDLPHPVAVVNVTVGGCPGTLVTGSAGAVASFGAAPARGDLQGVQLTKPVVGMAATPDGSGYWLTAADGGVFAFGSGFYGSAGNLTLTRPVVGMAPTPDGRGYWLVASDGGVFAYGDAGFYGSAGNLTLTRPVVGMAPTPDGRGYWLVASDGGVFAYGDAGFYGSAGNLKLTKPVVAMAATSGGHGYWLVGADGGIFAFGDAPFEGSFAARPLPAPVVGMAASTDGRGYLALDALGDLAGLGDATAPGSVACPANAATTYGVDPDLMADTGGGSQLVTIVDPTAASVAGTATAWATRPGGCWAPVAPSGQPAGPYRVETGEGGMIPVAARVSGDHATPEGVFGIGPTMYGVSTTAPNPAYGYHHLVCGDWWDEQPGTAAYNTFQHYACGTTPPFSPGGEALWTSTVDYVHFAWIETPFVPQNAAGIFLHDDTPSGVTEGCVALPPATLDGILGWFSPAAQPHVAVGTTATIGSL